MLLPRPASLVRAPVLPCSVCVCVCVCVWVCVGVTGMQCGCSALAGMDGGGAAAVRGIRGGSRPPATCSPCPVPHGRDGVTS